MDEEKFIDEPEVSQDDDNTDVISKRFVKCTFLQLTAPRNNIPIRESEVKSLTLGGRNLDALKVSLTDPPIYSKDESAKVIY